MITLYIYTTRDLVGIIWARPKGLEIILTWVDTLYFIYNNIEGYIWGVTSIGVGALHTKRSNQKLNAKSLRNPNLLGLVTI